MIINGRKVDVVGCLKYDDLVELALGPQPKGRVFTVVYTHAEHDTEGCLIPGDSVTVTERTVVSVADTSNA